jgi:pilus assembly protein Flp/PilA
MLLLRFKLRSALRFLSARSGATAIEYALLAALIAVIAIVGLKTLGSKVNSNFQSISNSMS